jgi:hypothetical protein
MRRTLHVVRAVESGGVEDPAELVPDHLSENGARLAQKMQVGPGIPVGIRL